MPPCLWKKVCCHCSHAVQSWGTEGRCAAMGNPQDEVPKAENVYDYIVFRAADVVDLRIDDPSPKKDVAAPQQVCISPSSVRTKSYGCKCGSTIPAVRERFSHVDSSAAFLLIPFCIRRTILTSRHPHSRLQQPPTIMRMIRPLWART